MKIKMKTKMNIKLKLKIEMKFKFKMKLKILMKLKLKMGGQPCSVVKAEDSQPRGRGIESLLALYTRFNVKNK